MEYRNTKMMKDIENKTETLSSNLHQASSKFYAEFLSATKIIKPTVEFRYKAINGAILMAQPYAPIFLDEYCPSDFRRSFDFIHELKVKDIPTQAAPGDQSVPHELTTAEVDDRVNEMLESEDSDLIWDL